ncbi:MAG: M14 family zinc carboxypeptidase [bacterium]
MRKIIVALLVLISFALAQDMIVRVYAPNWQDIEKISPKYDLDIASARVGEYYDIVADHDVLMQIRGSGLPYEIIVFSIAHIKEQVRADYLSYAEVNDSLQQMVQNYPSICKLDSLPIPTYQGRWMYGIKISDNVYVEEDDEPGFLVDGLHHSREWACIPVVLFFADSLLNAYGQVQPITDIIDNTEIYCFPIINADGYVYDYPGGNWWRKNREPFGGSTGTDPNRNYAGCTGDIEGDWGAVDNGKATHSPSSETFCGAYVNSGDETRALTLYAEAHEFNAYMSYHSSGEMIMWPWGWKDQESPDSALYNHFGNNAADLVQCLYGGTYDRGPIGITIYPVSGSSVDWLYSWSRHVHGVSNLSFTTELGTAFYQAESQLDHINHQNFKALEYLAGICDSIVLLVRTLVPPPTIYPLGTVSEDFTIYWHAKNPVYNEPLQWELVELSNPSMIEDDFESGTSRWVLDGFTLSTSQAHSGTHSLFSGNVDDMNHGVQTIHPYLVQTGDSLTFWCRYNLETNYDVAVVEISEDTKYWYNMDTTRFNGNQSSWVRKAYSLNNWVGKSVYFRFRSMTDGNTLSGGFYVDDVYPVCLFADVNTISSTITDTSYQFTGHAEGEYFYYVRGYNNDWGWGDYSCLARADVVVGIAETPKSQEIISSNLTLSLNPGIKSITLDYAISQGVHDAYIKIYDAVGKLVKSYDVSTEPQAMHHRIVWHAINETGTRVPAGVYFIHLKAGNYQKTEKAVLLK